METVDNRTFKQKVHEWWVKKKNRFEEIKHKLFGWMDEHPVETLGILSVSIPTLLKVVNSLIRLIIQGKEMRYDECHYYDRRTNKHWYLKRKPSRRQQIEIDRRYEEGESYRDILLSLRLI